MNDQHESDDDYGRHVLPWRRRRPDDPDGPTPDDVTPDDGRGVSRRRDRPLLRGLLTWIGAWFSLSAELPVVLRLLLWGLVALLAAAVWRTLRGVRR